MNKSTVIAIAASLVILTSCGASDPTPVIPPAEELPGPGEEDGPTGDEAEVIFLDDFNSFDNSVWTKETHETGWTNEELQAYRPSQVSVGKDGDKTVLMLTAERRDGKIVSGRVNSKGKKSFGYGKVEASIRLPETADGLWPAFWMMGDNNREWPACGEIDIMEMGDAEGIKSGTSQRRVNTALHFGPDAAGHLQEYFAGNARNNLQDGQYHTYGIHWNAAEITVYVDGDLFKRFDIKENRYFQDDFYLLFNLAVGGLFTGITDPAGITALAEGEKAVMYVDWVKITKLK